MKVAVRVRPFKNSEGKLLQWSQQSILHVSEDGALIFDPVSEVNKKEFYFHGKKQTHRDITVVNKNLSFKFDDIFDEAAQNRDVFERLTKPLVHALMDGVNCSFLSYGATGTGKTHSILGNSSQRGIAYLTMEYVFFQLKKRVSNEWIYEVNVSYFEVYDEKVYNLLAKSKPVTISQRNNGDMSVDGLSMRKVNNLTEVQKLLTIGNRNRTRASAGGSTHNNHSNTIFQVDIKAPNEVSTGNATCRIGKLQIVELGGSERNTAQGNRSYDNVNVSKPMLTLKNCIHRLADGSKNIPFNDSQLTKILKNSFSNNCLTAILFNVSASPMNYSDTYNTLTYAKKARMIGRSSEKPTIPMVPSSTSAFSNRTFVKTNAPHASTTVGLPDKSLYTESFATGKCSRTVRNPSRKRSDSNIEITELTRWYYEVDTIYDVVKNAIEGYCTSVSKEKLLDLRLKCRRDVEKCRTMLTTSQSHRMAKVRVQSVFDEITKKINAVPTPSNTNYWKSRLQVCQQQLLNLHRKIKGSKLDDVLETYVCMKELEVAATKTYYQSMLTMKVNAIYVNQIEICGYLSVFNAKYEGDESMHETFKNRQRFNTIEIEDIVLPLFKNYSKVK